MPATGLNLKQNILSKFTALGGNPFDGKRVGGVSLLSALRGMGPLRGPLIKAPGRLKLSYLLGRQGADLLLRDGQC